MHTQPGTPPMKPLTSADPRGPDQPELPSTDMPPGDHPLEIAARRGIGPLSPSGRGAWHGHTEPCVSCGQLNLRGATECEACGQDLSPEMRRKMLEAAGPWFVFEHVRPFPGISWERMLRQIRRGVITPTSIVRGPTTDFQWRFAGHTPGLAQHFGMCWHCGESVSPSDRYCSACLSHLDGAPAKTLTEASVAAVTLLSPKDAEPRPSGSLGPAPPSVSTVPAKAGPMFTGISASTSPSTKAAGGVSAAPVNVGGSVPSAGPSHGGVNEELLALRAVLEQAEVDAGIAAVEPLHTSSPRSTWLVAALFVLFFAGLIALVKVRERRLEYGFEPSVVQDADPVSPVPDPSATSATPNKAENEIAPAGSTPPSPLPE